MQEHPEASSTFPSPAHLRKLHQAKLKQSDRPGPEHKNLQIKMFWQGELIRIEHFGGSKSVTLGSQKSCDIPVAIEELTAEAFELVKPSADGFEVHWADWMHVALMNENSRITVATQEKKRALKLNLNDRVLIQAGPVYLLIQYVRPARPFKHIWKSSFDSYFSKILSFSIVFHAFIIAALMLTPLDPFGLNDEFNSQTNRFAQITLVQHEEVDVEFVWNQTQAKPSASGAAHEKETGELGKPQAKQRQAAASKPGAPTIDPNTRERDRQIASSSGIFSALEGMKEITTSSVFGPGGLGTGINSALGGLEGINHGETAGAGGMGTRGAGPGGSGQSIGIGGLGNGSGIGPGGDDLITSSLPGKKRIQVKPQRIELKGCLKPQTVRRMLSRYQSQARYCYEKELPRNPNLAGKVTTSFVIGPTGSVIQSKIESSTLQSSNVETCLLRSLQRMKFPACQGGGNAYVTYPWIFKSSGN